MGRFAILGWGSLIWDPQDLELATEWMLDGPSLKLEFSRLSRSRGGALTLVIDPVHGEANTVLYALSARSAVEDVISDLRRREITSAERIGFFDVPSGRQRCNADPSAAAGLRMWTRAKHLQGTVWTDLSSNFCEERGCGFSIDAAAQYLLYDLHEPGLSRAKEYVRRTPTEISTPLRRRLENERWTN